MLAHLATVLPEPARADLIAEYRFEAGSELVDSTGTTGVLVPVDRGAAGLADYSISDGILVLPGFINDGTFDYLTTPDFGFDSTHAWTLVFDIRDPGGAGGPGTGAAAIISSQSPGAPDSWQLDNNLSTGSSVGEFSGTAFGSLSDGAWHTIHLVHEAGSSTLAVYFDGVDVTGSAGWAAGRVALENLTFATRSAGNGPTATASQASVEIDNVKIHNSVEIPAAPAPLAIASFTTSDHYVTPGTPVTLSWQAAGASSYDITGLGAVTPSGTAEVVVNSTTTFTFRISNGDTIESAQLTVHAGPEKPNIILVLIDDFGITDTSVPFIFDESGNPVSYNFNQLYHTPTMETLAADGMRFTNFYAQAVCSPTRVSLMTGLNSPNHGVTSHITQNGTRHGTNSPLSYNLDGMTTPDMETLPRWLSEAGYRTISCGKGHFTWQHDISILEPVELPTFIGFDVSVGGSSPGQPGSFFGTSSYGRAGFPSFLYTGLEDYHGTNTFMTEALGIEAGKALDEAVDRGQPFFLYMSHYAVHTPWAIDPRATGDYSALAPGSDAHKFATMVEGMDLAVGELLDHVKNSLPPGVAENTLVIFLGDNGSDNPLTAVNQVPPAPYNDFPLSGKKGCRTEGGTKVPLIFAWAKPDPTNPLQAALPIPANSHEDDITACWDLPVTIMNLANLPIPVPVQGHDLSEYLRQTPGTHRPQEILLYYPHGRNDDYFANFRQGDWKLSYSFQDDTFRLYDLASDPTEVNDLAATNPEKVLAMSRAMARGFDGQWGPLGPLWPYFSSADLPLLMPDMADYDLDNDGRIDALEDPNRNGLLDAGETDPDDTDTDKDGSDDHTEIRLGLDPRDATSFFRAKIGPAPASGYEVRWPSQPGLTFSIRHSADLALPLSDWEVETGVPASADGSETSWTYDGLDDRQFFMIGLE